MNAVEILFHDSPTPARFSNIVAIVHGPSAVTLHAGNGKVYTYPWCNVQRVLSSEDNN